VRNRCYSALAILVALAASGCGVGKSDFQRQSGDAGAELAAAAHTLRAVHEGQLDVRYARASFVNYRESLSGVEANLSSPQTGPETANRNNLIQLYRRAQPALQEPCLESDCNWRAQLDALDAASAALIEAGG
jgi:hypothetical protein